MLVECSCGTVWSVSSIGLGTVRRLVQHWEAGHSLAADPATVAAIREPAEVYARNRAKLDSIGLTNDEDVRPRP